MASMSGGERIVRMLAEEGVDVVFGIIDGSYFGLYSKLGEYGIRLITPRHETSAVHMAGAYARLTGRLGVCIASNGPGAANALPGVAVENGEGNRVLLITSWRRSGIVDPDRGGTYQYFDQVAVMAPMSRFSQAAESFERIPEVVSRALRCAWQGRPGVTHVCVPEDVLNGEFELPGGPEIAAARHRRGSRIAASPEAIRSSADWLLQARAPLIQAGSGVLHARATASLRELAEWLRAPVTTSWGARDALDERSLLAVPMHCLQLVNRVRNEADVVLALGTRFGETDWWGRPPYWRSPSEQRLIQVDVDEASIGLNRPVDLGVMADAGVFLDQLLTELKGRPPAANQAEREARLEGCRVERASTLAQLAEPLANRGAPMHSAHVAHVCREFFDDDAVLVIDGGNTAVWANFHHEVRQPHSLLSTYKFGMLGAGVSQALGARAAFPERQVYCITGDGAMGFHSQEIETAVRNDLPVIILVLCDRQWGMVKVNQEFAIDPRRTLLEGGLTPQENINTDLGEIRFDRLAESMGAHAERVQEPSELRPALERCVAAGRCAVVHIDVDPRAHKFAPHLDVFKAMHLEPQSAADA